MAAQHTQERWIAVSGRDGNVDIGLPSIFNEQELGERIATVWHDSNYDLQHSQADLIVRAVNSHALMLEALRDALEELETLISADQKDTLRDPITDSTTDERVVRIRAAIRAATGEDA